jgi:hypothetical protein
MRSQLRVLRPSAAFICHSALCWMLKSAEIAGGRPIRGEAESADALPAPRPPPLRGFMFVTPRCAGLLASAEIAGGRPVGGEGESADALPAPRPLPLAASICHSASVLDARVRGDRGRKTYPRRSGERGCAPAPRPPPLRGFLFSLRIVLDAQIRGDRGRKTYLRRSGERGCAPAPRPPPLRGFYLSLRIVLDAQIRGDRGRKTYRRRRESADALQLRVLRPSADFYFHSALCWMLKSAEIAGGRPIGGEGRARMRSSSASSAPPRTVVSSAALVAGIDCG